MKQLDLPKFLQKRITIRVFDRFDACILKNKRGNVVETIYENLKIFCGEMNELCLIDYVWIYWTAVVI